MHRVEIAEAALLASVAFVVPMRVDGPDRHWNLKSTLGFLTRNCPDADILVVEQDVTSQIQDVLAMYPQVRHLLQLNAGSFKKAEAVNAGACDTDRRYICIYDTDVLIAPQAIAAALHAMERRGWRIALPFNHIFLDVRGSLRTRLGEQGVIAGYDQICRLELAGSIPESTPRFLGGGICIIQREIFLAEGGLNKKMVSYGWEDTELIKRFDILGYPVLRIPGFNLIHLDHARGVDSKPNQHFATNEQEFRKVSAMSREELQKYVVTDLSLTCLGDSAALARVRTEARCWIPVGLMRLVSFVTLVRIHVRAHGWQRVIGRALPSVLQPRNP
ncbi:galactosyltransferase-related protein [Roseateles sp.]|uniref:galactosyltransferase-related protein n=1 Tax=Roseateles sp. TaxID=1971397 RepID=UPI0026CC206A